MGSGTRGQRTDKFGGEFAPNSRTPHDSVVSRRRTRFSGFRGSPKRDDLLSERTNPGRHVVHWTTFFGQLAQLHDPRRASQLSRGTRRQSGLRLLLWRRDRKRPKKNRTEPGA